MRRRSAIARSICCSDNPSSSNPTSVSASHGTVASCFAPASAWAARDRCIGDRHFGRSEEHTSELQSVKISYAVFCLKKKSSPKLYEDRKSTRVNYSHVKMSYAVFCSNSKH